MTKEYKAFYLRSLALILALSSYPIYMGAKTLAIYLIQGVIQKAQYTRYVIPYAPICLAVLLVTALLPFIQKRAGKHPFAVMSCLGVTVFFVAELLFERIVVIDGSQALELSAWQYSLCVATPEVLRAAGQLLYAQENPDYKIHFYLIAVLIVLTVTGLMYGFARMVVTGDTSKRKPLRAQLVA